MLTEEESKLFKTNADRAIKWHKKEAEFAQRMAEWHGRRAQQWARAMWFFIGCCAGTFVQLLWAYGA